MWYEYKEVREKLLPEIRDVWTIKEVIEKTAGLGDKIFLIDAVTGKQYSYQDSNVESNKIANSLISLGVQKGDRVALFLRNCPEYVFSIFACGKAGLVEVPINVAFREPEITHMISTAQISTVIVESDKAFLEELGKVSRKTPFLKNVLVFGAVGDDPAMAAQLISLNEMLPKADASDPKVDVKGNDPFCIFFTSGTTGLPKGAPISNKTCLLAAESACALPMSENERNYTCLPLFHVNAQLYSVMAMRCTGNVLILSDRFSPKKIFGEIKNYGATYFNYIGGLIQMLDRSFDRREDVPDHGARFCFGAPSPPEGFEQKFGVEAFEGYSMSEVPVIFGNLDPDRSKRKKRSFGMLIFPDLGREAKVVDDNGKEVGTGLVGELIQRGTDFITEGYWGAPEATKEAIDEDGWFHTGDLVKKDEDGYYYYIDRKKFMIRRAGENIATAEIEFVVNSHPAVEASAAIPAPDPVREEEVKILIMVKQGATVKMEELIEHCCNKLSHIKVPRYIEVVQELPKTATDRIQKVKLKELERQREDHGWDRDKEIPDWRKKYYGTT
jgi:acyl-CoA synthetase (AMP-forming)/AMP-acid ligase II